MSESSISIQKIDPVVWRRSILSVLSRNLPDAATNGRFDWAYSENPHGVARVWVAFVGDGEVVGTSAAFPRRFSIGGQTLLALVLSDFAIDPQYRSLGPALQLMRGTLAELQRGEFAFAIDYPSDSMRAVHRRLGGIELGSNTRYVRPLRVSGSLRKRWGSGLAVRSVAKVGDVFARIADRRRAIPRTIAVHAGDTEYDEEFARLAVDALDGHMLYGQREVQYLNWRFRSGLRFSYTTIALRSSGRLLAYAVFRHRGTTEGTVVEFVAAPDGRIREYLFTAVLEWARSKGFDYLQASALAGGSWASLLDGLGFVARETGPGPMFFLSENWTKEELGLEPKRCWLTDGDRDG